eukprot:Selendium_serpulae@DN6200_c2_g1_i10.p1
MMNSQKSEFEQPERMERMTITFRLTCGTIFEVDAHNGSTSVRELKEEVFRERGIAVDVQRLLKKGKTLKDEATLDTLGIKHGDTLAIAQVRRPITSPDSEAASSPSGGGGGGSVTQSSEVRSAEVKSSDEKSKIDVAEIQAKYERFERLIEQNENLYMRFQETQLPWKIHKDPELLALSDDMANMILKNDTNLEEISQRFAELSRLLGITFKKRSAKGQPDENCDNGEPESGSTMDQSCRKKQMRRRQ